MGDDSRTVDKSVDNLGYDSRTVDNLSKGGIIMRISLDKLVGMMPQAIGSNKDLVREFAKVRKELLNKKFNVLTFENTTER